MPRASRSNSFGRRPKASPKGSRHRVADATLELGCDIVEIRRIRRLAKKTPRFLPRVFTKAEIAYCRTKSDPWQHFAVRFAAKEAVWKALGSAGLALRDISVSRDSKGKPGVLLRGKPSRGLRISLTHSDEYAMAVALRMR